LAQLTGAHHPDSRECIRDGIGQRVSARPADLRHALGRVLQCRTCLRTLAAQAPEERDPEIRVADDLRIRALFAEGERTLEPMGRRLAASERPGHLCGAERSTQSQVDPPIVVSEIRLGTIEEGEGLTGREALQRVLARDDEVLDRRGRVAGAFEVHRDDRGQLSTPLWIQREQRVRGEAVQGPPVLFQQRAVRGILHECVSEEILELRLERCHLHESARLQVPELVARAHPVVASRSRSSIVTPNWRPITAATRSVRLLSGGSRSIRASSSPWSVSGISTSETRAVATQRSASRTMAPRSMSIRMTSSTKNGLPSDFSRM